MNLKIKTPNGFKSDFYISPEFISTIGLSILYLHLAGIIWFLLFFFVRLFCETLNPIETAPFKLLSIKNLNKKECYKDMHSFKRLYQSRRSSRSRSWLRLRRHSSQSQSRLQWQSLKSFLLRLRPHPQNTKSSQNLLQSRECPKLLLHPIDMIPSSKNRIHHILWIKVENSLFTSLCFLFYTNNIPICKSASPLIFP